MFETHPDYEITGGLPPELFGLDPGIKCWRAFDVMFHDFWIIAEILIGKNDEQEDPLWKTICTSDIQSLIGLLAAELVIEHRLNLVIPTYHEANQQIAIKPVLQIISADEDGQPSMMIFVTSDNARYVKSLLELTEADATNKKVLYARSKIASRE
jgi:hypothetical protein